MKTLSDYLVFHCIPETLGTDIKAKALEEKITPFLSNGEGKGALADFVFLLVHTTAIDCTFDGSEKPALVAFRDTWQRRDRMTPEALWEWRLGIPWPILQLWNEAFFKAQALFEVPPEQLPTEALSPTQKAEAAQPDAPLP